MRRRATARSALTALRFTATLDVNATYLHEGVGYSPSADKVNYSIQKNAYESRWLAGYNGLSTSVVGLKMKEDLGRVGLPVGRSIGVLEAGVNPYSGMFYNGPRSLADNNVRPAGTLSLAERRTSTAAAPVNGTTRRASSASATRSTAP